MESAIAQMVSRYDGGAISRRELIQGLAILAAAAAGTTGSAIAAAPFHVSSFAHVSLQVKNLDRSVQFYQEVLGLPFPSGDRVTNPPGESRLKVGSGTLTLRQAEPPGTVDHMAFGADRFDKTVVTDQLKQQGIAPFDTDGPLGFYVRDPDGYPVQIVATNNRT